MKEDLMLDLRLSRARAGLSGHDLAHLLGCPDERISRLENRNARLRAEELAALCLIYGCEPEEWLYHLSRTIAENLKRRLAEMPAAPRYWDERQAARTDTLNTLTHRLQILSNTPHAT